MAETAEKHGDDGVAGDSPLLRWDPVPRERAWLLGGSLAGFLLCVPMILGDRIPSHDAAGRYLPMIADFVAGDWRAAFHPRVQPLLTILAGIPAKLGMDPFIATKLIGSVFFALTVFPLYGAVHRVLGRHYAFGAVALYLPCPRLLRIAGMGIRDSGKTFFLILGAWALLAFWQNRKWPAALAAGAAAAGLTLVRVEGLATAAALLVCLLIIVWRSPGRPVKALGQVAAAIGLTAIFVLPWVMYCFKATGYAVSGSQQIVVWRKLEKLTGLKLHCNNAFMLEQDPDRPATLCACRGRIEHHEDLARTTTGRDASWKYSVASRRAAVPLAVAIVGTTVEDLQRPRIDWEKVGLELIEGLIPLSLVFALPVIFLRVRDRKWTAWESVIAVVVGFHIFMLLLMVVGTGGTMVSKRYVISATPLTFGWTAMGVAAMLRWLKPRSRRAMWALVVLFVFFSVRDAWSRVRRHYTSRRDRNQKLLAAGNWLRQQALKDNLNRKPGMPSTWFCYRTGRRPIIMTSESALTYFADGETIDPRSVGETFTVPEISRFCRVFDVDYIIWDRTFAARCPGLRDPAHPPPGFVVINETWRSGKYPLAILQWLPAEAPAP